MKKFLARLLVIALLLSNLFMCTSVFGLKAETKRNIAIVYDNSGSMYVYGEKAWCRATYAMEVFASMLNEGDSLAIYPMNPIEVSGKQYTMDAPFEITNPSQAAQIREIYTAEAMDTHIESIDAAIKGLTPLSGEKYLIVLTDGQVFYENGKELTVADTKKELEERFNKHVGPDLNILYLGIGSQVAMPEMDSKYYLGVKASDSKNVLSALTMMSNRIFARDILPESHISGKTINFDISLSKLIVFAQGENVSDVKITGKNGATATLVSGTKTKYSSKGAGNYQGSGQSPVDKSLQGMIVTYTNCPSGEYELSYSGNVSNVEIYYEPDADLNFIFTDEDGNLVEPEELYKGDYKVQFGLVDAQTGDLISSDLIGKPKFTGEYVVNGKSFPIRHSGKSGETPVKLKEGDTFTAKLTASYLDGYSITKTAKDFGWPEDSLNVVARPIEHIKLEITDGAKVYHLNTLEQGETYTAKVFYKGTQLTGDELKKVDLKWEPEKSKAEIKKEFKDDHYALSLHYKDPNNPLGTKCGKCTVTIYAYYTDLEGAEAQGKSPLKYVIEDKIISPEINLSVPQSHFQISKLDKGKPIKAIITSKGEKLSEYAFNALEFEVDCSGLGYKITPLPDQSAYEIKLDSTGAVEKGKYDINVKVTQKDNLGRSTSADEKCDVRLSNMPLWLEWLILIVAMIVLIFLIYKITHIKCLPTKLHAIKKQGCEMNIGGEDVTQNTAFNASIEGGVLTVEAKYAGTKTGIRMNVTPGNESYLMTKQVKRRATVEASSVKKGGTATIEEATVGNRKYVMNPETFKLEPALAGAKDFDLSNGNTVLYSGLMQKDGVNEPFYVRVKLHFKK